MQQHLVSPSPWWPPWAVPESLESLVSRRMLRWRWAPGGPLPESWWWTGTYGPLRASLRGICELLAARDSVFQSAATQVPGVCHTTYSAASIHQAGTLENLQPDGTWIPQNGFGGNSCPRESLSCWLLCGVMYSPAEPPLVPGGVGSHASWKWPDTEVWALDLETLLHPADLRRVRRAYLGIYRLLRLSNPEFFISTCRLLEEHPADFLRLPQEAFFFLVVSLEFLTLIAIEQRVPRAPFFAWVGTSARRGP